jgi:ribosomal protein L37AE/L43A
MATVHHRVNNPEACICCGRRADGLAVGRPGRLGWYCAECTPELARIALTMATSNPRHFDTIELKAAELVAEAAGGDISMPAAELPAFVSWAVKEFAEQMRKMMEAGAAPF